MSDVAAPLQTEWWDLDATLESVLHTLRLASADVDEPKLRYLVPIAGFQINERLDRTEELSEEEAGSLQHALEQLTIALYRPAERDASDGTFINPIDTVVGQIMPARERWGVA